MAEAQALDDAAAWVAVLEAELRRRRTLAAQTERLGRIGTWQLDLDTNELTWSEGTYRLFGMDPREPVTLDQATSFYPGAARLELAAAFAEALASGEAYDLTVQCRMRDGSEPWIRSIGQLEVAADGTRRMIGVVRDVTAEHVAEMRLRHLAEHDALTGLCNRRMLLEALERSVASGAGSALLLLDLDRFKDVNDLHGHGVGDALLTEVAGRLRRGVRSGDVVARLGGDEFALVLHGIDAAADVTSRANALLTLFQEPANLAPGPLSIGVSLGAVVFPEGGATPGELLKNADIALYHAKSRGRGQAAVFSRRMGAALEDRLLLLAEIRAGLRRGELEVHYQPIVDLRTRIVRGLEALVRWRHPKRGLLSPAAFQTALDDPATSAEIGSFVLAASLRQMRGWIDAGVPVTCVNVNVSDSQLRQDDALFHEATGLLKTLRLTPDRLKLEILESAFLGDDGGAVAKAIARFQSHGIIMALDDFGTGHASLTHLKQFHVSRIKIDRSFTRGLGSDADNTAITRAIIDLGSNLGIRVTAEGIEDLPQFAALLELDCDCAQGYLFSRPMPTDAVPGFLARWSETGAGLFASAATMSPARRAA